MVKLDALKWSQPDRPWFQIGTASEKQEAKIREYAQMEGFENLRGYWRHMESEGWDYYDVIRMSYR
jgi:hypothetical protein